MFEKLGGRKMVAATLTVAVGIGMSLAKGDIPPNLLYLLISIFGVFAGTNTISTLGGISLEKKTLDVKAVEPTAQEVIASPGIPVQDAVAAFAQLDAKIEASALAQASALQEVIKSTQLTQNAISIVLEKVLK